jgi:hypothetical protein
VKQVPLKIFILFCALLFTGCTDNNYPKNMSKKERAAYYKDYNESKTKEEWKKIREERKSKEKTIEENINEETSKY